MIDINGIYYKIDMDKLMEWVAKTPSNEKNVGTTTTVTYLDTDDETPQKEITESKTTLNDNMNNIRYDFIKNLLTTIFSVFPDEMGQVEYKSFKNFTIGQKLCFNTLLAKKIIVQVSI